MGISPRGPERYNPHRMYGAEREMHHEDLIKFGHEAERVAPQILDTLPFVESVAHTSKIDDKRQGIDFLLKIKEGGMVGISFSVAQDRADMRKNLREALANPIIPKLHNEDGEVFSEVPIPRVELHGGRRDQWEKMVQLQKEGKPIPEDMIQQVGSFFAQEMLIYSKFVADNNKRVAPTFQKLALLVEKSLLEEQGKKVQ